MRRMLFLIFSLVLFSGGAAMAGLVDNDDGTVTDTETGLMWQKATAPNKYTWQQALAYAEGLTLAGNSDWRLPNRNELQTLVDYSRYNPAIYPLLAPQTVSWNYWSSTIRADRAENAWRVDFYYGYVSAAGNKSYSYYVRAVRTGLSIPSNNVTILSPNGGETFTKGGAYPITWDSNVTENLQIDLYKGDSPVLSIASVDPSAGSYSFAPPLSLDDGNDYRICLRLSDDSLSDFSDAFFSIKSGEIWQPVASGTTNTLMDVWGSGMMPRPDVFAVGYGGVILHYDGKSWSPMISTTNQNLHGVLGSGTDVFAVGANGTILHYNGNAWSAMPSGVTNGLNGIWGSRPSNVFAVGDNSTLLHYDGSSWSSINNPGSGQDFYGVWGRSETDVFVVGDGGIILHYNGAAWELVYSGGTGTLYDVFDLPDSENVYATGDSGTIFYFDGSTWRPMSSGTDNSLKGGWSKSVLTGDVIIPELFSAGGNGTLLQSDSVNWWIMESGTTNGLESIWGSVRDDLFAVGHDGTILHYSDPATDSDSDGLTDDFERTILTDPFDADTDDDGIQDGTEKGITSDDIGPYTNTDIFQPDLDPASTTDPLLDDSDTDGISDGLEDANHNGRMDPGETDPGRGVVAGDVNGNGTVELSDAVFALKIMARESVGGNIFISADVNMDEKIGIAEIIYVLRYVAFGPIDPVH